jgi:hypothetical protein
MVGPGVLFHGFVIFELAASEIEQHQSHWQIGQRCNLE